MASWFGFLSVSFLFFRYHLVLYFRCDFVVLYDNNLLSSNVPPTPQQLTKLHQLAMQQTPFTPLGQTTPAFPGTYPQPFLDILLFLPVEFSLSF